MTAAVRSLWGVDSEPVDVIPDDTDAPELAVWMEEQLTRHGIGRDCYVATAVLRRIAAELALELDQARAELGSNVTRIPLHETERTCPDQR